MVPVPLGPSGVAPVVEHETVTKPVPVVGTHGDTNNWRPVEVSQTLTSVLMYASSAGSNVTVVSNDPTPHELVGCEFTMVYDDPAVGTAGDHGAVVVTTVVVLDCTVALVVVIRTR
jgi:hypothetical protein